MIKTITNATNDNKKTGITLEIKLYYLNKSDILILFCIYRLIS